MGETVRLKTRFSRYFSYAFVAAILLLSVFLGVADPTELTSSVPILLAVGITIWVVFAHPHVEVADGGITLVNVISTIHIPWPRFTGASTQWNLQIHTDAGTYTAWALPIASGTARRLPGSRGADHGAEYSSSPNTAQGAALLIGERHQELKEAGYLSGKTQQRVEVTRRPTTVSLAGAATTAVLLVLALV